ncbi:MAG: MarR family transcriptional regulator [Cytophagaceae bacterium]|nr:MAG: MarR family transcriptional regulator [Cytophagaceae bacterium]
MSSSPRTTFDRIVHIETLLWNLCDAELRRQVGFPMGRLEVLRSINEIEGCRVNDIAERLAITIGAVSKLVDRLESSGLCQRKPNPEDRRSSLLAVTDIGLRTLEQADNVLEPLLERWFTQINLRSLNDGLIQIERNLDVNMADS